MNASVAPAMDDAAGARPFSSLLDADRGQLQLWLLLLAITAVRVVGLAASNAELFYDEAQYWVWAQEPAFGYYTKPPLLAWIIGATTAVCGDTPFCVRLPSPFLHLATSMVIYALAAKLLTRRVAFWSALLYAILPGTSISGILISTDVPLLLCWSLALLALAYHVEKPSLAAGIALGIAVGLGLNAKYAMAFIVPCYALYAILSPRARASLRHPGTWLALVVALLIIAPNLQWNASHQFATFEHTVDNADWGHRFPNVLGLLAFVGMQAAIIGPVLFGAYALVVGGRVPAIVDEPRRFLVAMSLPVFALIAGQAFISKANGNWAAVAFPAAVILATAAVLALDWRRGMVVTLLISIPTVVGASFAGSFAGVVNVPPIGRELGKLVGWGDFAAKVAGIAEANDVKTLVFLGRGLTASMMYELRGRGFDIRSYLADAASPQDHFEMTRPWRPKDAGPVLLVYVGTGKPPGAVAKRAKLVERFGTQIFLARGGDWKASAYRID